MSPRPSPAFRPAVLAGLLTVSLLAALTGAARSATPSSVLPPASTVKGWKMLGQPRQYNSANLFQLINGEAEAVMRYAFSSLAHAEYGPAGAKQPALTVDVFDMGDPLNAFGLFSSSDRGSGPKVALGAEGVRIGSSGLNFWKGRYVVRTAIIGRGAGSASLKSAQMALAKAAAARVSGASGPPALLNALPPGRQANSERYVRTNVAGQTFLRNAVTARYTSAGDRAELFIAQYPSASQAQSALASFQAREKTGQGYAAWKVADGGFSVRDRYMKGVAAARKGRHIVGVVRANDAAAARSLVQKALPRVR